MKRYSRIIVLLGVCISCVVVNVWLVMTGHNRLPLLVFVLCVVGTPLVLKWLPPVTTDPQKIRNIQVLAASGWRWLGWFYIAGLIIGTLNFIVRRPDVPTWAVVMAIGWSVFFIWSCFWMARRFKRESAKIQKPLQ